MLDKIKIVKEKTQEIYRVLEKDVKSKLCIIKQRGNYVLAIDDVPDIKIIDNNELLNILSNMEEWLYVFSKGLQRSSI